MLIIEEGLRNKKKSCVMLCNRTTTYSKYNLLLLLVQNTKVAFFCVFQLKEESKSCWKKNYWNNILWLLSTSKNIEEVKCFCRSCSGIGISNGILYLASDAASDYDLKILRQQKTKDNNSTRHTRSSRIKQKKRPSEELFFSTSLVRVFYNQMEWHSFASFFSPCYTILLRQQQKQ